MFADPRRRLRSSLPVSLPPDQNQSDYKKSISYDKASVGKDVKKGSKHFFSTSIAVKSIALTVAALALIIHSSRTVGVEKRPTFNNVAASNTSSSAVLTQERYDAVIVGAGWAGIRAAEILIKGGVENILVLEAHDYIGGRLVPSLCLCIY